MNKPGLIPAQWPAPAGVCALASTRVGGHSQGPYTGFNLGAHVGDDPRRVAANRADLISACPGLEGVAWLEQVHGTDVAHLSHDTRQAVPPRADAAITASSALACAVMTADCLPVLLCDRDGRQVAAAHAGWRGLAAGVLENTVAAFAAPAGHLLAWLGPAISAAHFEVGPEVRDALLDATPTRRDAVAQTFVRGRDDRWYADLAAIARIRLRAVGVAQVYGGHWCTYADRADFYSYRRDGITGRQVSLIYRV